MIDINSFKKRMKTTAYAKFDAHKRYERLNNTSLFALTSASLLLIFITLFSKYCDKFKHIIEPFSLELFSLLVSIIILVLSLVVSFASYALKSERCLRFGNDIIELVDKLLIAKTDFEKSKIINEYNIIRKSADNHKKFNYIRGRLERKEEEKNEKTVIIINKESYFYALEYWSPIIGFYFISVSSISLFIIMTIYCISHA